MERSDRKITLHRDLIDRGKVVASAITDESTTELSGTAAEVGFIVTGLKMLRDRPGIYSASHGELKGLIDSIENPHYSDEPVVRHEQITIDDQIRS